jgi:hypothetical protein
MDWEDTFVSWSKGPGITEQQKSLNAVTAIKKAIESNDKLSRMDISVFSQGSYRARTNVRQDSDVDVCVCLNSVFFADYPPNNTDESYGNYDGEIDFKTYKSLIEIALRDYFGNEAVTRGKKAFDVYENSYRIDADVIPAFRHRRYDEDGSNNWIKPEGVGFITDYGIKIKNWPEQTYLNGVEKNISTDRRYKRVIRIIKRLRNQMQEENIAEAKDIASFLIESLVWNVPPDRFGQEYYWQDVRAVLAYTFNNTRSIETCKEWGEVNELKYLFRVSQPWTLLQAHSFINAAWDYLEFE